MQLFSSGHFALTEIRTSGKKDVAGVLSFEGLPSPLGSHMEVLALEDGVVLEAGRISDLHSRLHRIGTFVRIGGRNGVCVTYGRLACRYVQSGDYVRAGDCIGIEGSSGSGKGEYLTLEFRRNNRRIDGCDYLGIPHKTCIFHPAGLDAADIVTKACRLDDNMRSHLDCAPNSDELWDRLLKQLDSDPMPKPQGR